MLATLLLPALAGTKPNAQSFQCPDNQRQLILAWQMYAEDNNGRLTPNGELGEQPATWPDARYQPGGQYAQWCPGDLSKTALIANQANFIRSGLIYPYVNTLNVYKCPADLSLVRFGPFSIARLRSYSMNCWLSPFPNKDATTLFGGAPARIFSRDTDMSRPGPSMTFAFIEENVNSLDDGCFVGSPGLPDFWINVPSTRHDGAASLSFADGHTEMKRWTDSVVLSQNGSNLGKIGSPTFTIDLSSGDNAWLEQRESSLIP